MKREDAIKAHGHHYSTSTYDHSIHENLGPRKDDDKNSFATIEDARFALQQALIDRANDRLAEIKTLLTSPGNRVRILAARFNFHSRSGKIKEAVTRLRAEEAQLHTDISNSFTGKIKFQPLPETIKIPHALEIGQDVHIVRADYLEPGIRTTTAKITDRTLWTGSFSRGDWDYIFAYRAVDENGRDYSFEYNNPDNSTAEIKNNYTGHRYFISRDAAEDHVLELSTRMAAQFNQLAAEYSARVNNRAKKDTPAPRPPQP
jgi:hypothetical protein